MLTSPDTVTITNTCNGQRHCQADRLTVPLSVAGVCDCGFMIVLIQDHYSRRNLWQTVSLVATAVAAV